MQNQEDRNFLLAQCEPGRRGTMGAADHRHGAMEKHSQRKLLQKQRKSPIYDISAQQN